MTHAVRDTLAQTAERGGPTIATAIRRAKLISTTSCRMSRASFETEASRVMTRCELHHDRSINANACPGATAIEVLTRAHGRGARVAGGALPWLACLRRECVGFGRNDHHPADAETVDQHAETRREERLAERHCDLTAVGERVE